MSLRNESRSPTPPPGHRRRKRTDSIWPTALALKELTADAEAKIAALVRKAVAKR